MYRLAVFNPHAGSGKTTLSANLGHALALAGRKVTLMDLDPRGALCDSLGLFRPPSHGVDQVLLSGALVESVSLSTREELHLVPPGEQLAQAVQKEEEGADWGRLRQAVSRDIPGRDILIMDCPSSDERLVANALLAADLALMPVSPDEAGAVELPQLLNMLGRFARVRGRELDYRVVINRMPVRRRLSGPSARFNDLAAGHLFRQTVCQTDLIAQAGSAGRTVFEYRPGCRAAQDFRKLATEWLSSVGY